MEILDKVSLKKEKQKRKLSIFLLAISIILCIWAFLILSIYYLLSGFTPDGIILLFLSQILSTSFIALYIFLYDKSDVRTQMLSIAKGIIIFIFLYFGLVFYQFLDFSPSNDGITLNKYTYQQAKTYGSISIPVITSIDNNARDSAFYRYKSYGKYPCKMNYAPDSVYLLGIEAKAYFDLEKVKGDLFYGKISGNVPNHSYWVVDIEDGESIEDILLSEHLYLFCRRVNGSYYFMIIKDKEEIKALDSLLYINILFFIYLCISELSTIPLCIILSKIDTKGTEEKASIS